MATITIITLITPEVLKDRTELHTDVDEKLIKPKIRLAQDLYVLPLLGTTLYNKIIHFIATATLDTTPATPYKFLLDNFLVDIMCNYTMAKLLPSLNAQYWNSGVSTKSIQNSTTVTGNDLKNLIADFISNGDNYSQRAKRYLQQNAYTSFPEYYQQVAGIDIIIPETNVWESPISMGGINNVKPHKYFND